MILQRTFRLLTVLVALAMLGLIGTAIRWDSQSPSTVSAKPLESNVAFAAAPVRPGFQGSLGCAAVACHGRELGDSDSLARDRDWYVSRAFTLWAEQDPHVHAYRDLHSELSQRMVYHLTGAEHGSAAYCETIRTQCFGCHAPTAEHLGASEATMLIEGIGCESCHGQADRWLLAHVREDLEATTVGMQATERSYERAATCASCHVGTGEPGKEVTHDLIAAGHPRLNFEYSAYNEALPKHWLPTGADVGSSKVWLEGQYASARAALQQTQQRATSGAVWPEFAEIDCYACHRSLEGDVAENAASEKTTHLGQLRLQRWYLAGPQAIGYVVNGEPLLQTETLDRMISADRVVAAEAVEQALGQLDRTIMTEGFSHHLDWGWQFAPIEGFPSDSTRWEVHANRYLLLSAVHASGRYELDRQKSNRIQDAQMANLKTALDELQLRLTTYHRALQPPAEVRMSQVFLDETLELGNRIERLVSKPSLIFP